MNVYRRRHCRPFEYNVIKRVSQAKNGKTNEKPIKQISKKKSKCTKPKKNANIKAMKMYAIS